MRRPLSELRAFGRDNAHAVRHQIEDNIFVAHPGCTEDSASSSSVVFESVAPAVRRSLPVHVGFSCPRGAHRTERHCNARESSEGSGLPTIGLMHSAAVAILPAIRLDAVLEGAVRRRAHVRVSGATVDHRCAPSIGQHLAANTHLGQADVVLTSIPSHRNPLDGTCVERLIVASNNQKASPLRKAHGEN